MLRGFRWRIVIPYTLFLSAVFLGLTVYLPGRVRAVRMADLQTRLTAEARLIAREAPPYLEANRKRETLDALARRWSAVLGAQVALLSPEGAVLGASDPDAEAADALLFQPELPQALTTGAGHSIRVSSATGDQMMYVAVPVQIGDQVRGVVRVAFSLMPIEAGVARLRQTLSLITGVTLLASTLLATLIAERTMRPIRRLTRAAQRMAQGDLSSRPLPTIQDEVGQLIRAFNHMVDQLRDQVGTLDEERSRLMAILQHMADGVLITDAAGRVQLINPAASRLLDTTETVAGRRSFAQVARHHRLIELWRRCREHGETQMETVDIEHRQLSLHVIVTPFRGGSARGYLVILQDLTQVRRLETVRRDFVSNISHELRTPLASLKALVDTLRDGALEDPPAARRFLDRIETEVDTLTQMVQELLELSRIESGQVPLRLHPTPVTEVVSPPVERLRPQAERAGLHLQLDLPPGLPVVLADAERVQQVVTNLVHNAIKFTPQGGKVMVTARLVDDEVVISVRDTGIGIPAQDLPRIFERFYKVDRARSGGGTGLGLAIAKHVVQAHGGRIWAESVEGRGSTFYFSLPAVKETVTQP